MAFSIKTANRKVTPLRLGVFIFAGLAACFTLSYFLYIVISGNDPYNRMMTTLLVTVMYLLPILAHLLFGDKVSDFVLTFYTGFLTVASLLGQVLRFNTHFPWYDKFCHFSFGYVGALAGLFVMCKLADYKTAKPALVIIVTFSVSMMCAACWEVMEYLSSRFLGQTAQGVPQETTDGKFIVDITDSMLDIIANLGGAALFLLHYALHKITKRSLLIGAVIKDFCSGPSRKDGGAKPKEGAPDAETKEDAPDENTAQN